MSKRKRKRREGNQLFGKECGEWVEGGDSGGGGGGVEESNRPSLKQLLLTCGETLDEMAHPHICVLCFPHIQLLSAGMEEGGGEERSYSRFLRGWGGGVLVREKGVRAGEKRGKSVAFFRCGGRGREGREDTGWLMMGEGGGRGQ